MNACTAVVLSKNPVTLTLPGVEVLGMVQTIKNATELHQARLDSLAHVKTPYFFFLDDDDALPGDYLDVLDECLAANVALAYTNELEVTAAGSRVLAKGPYSQEAHAKNPMLVHHLVLMNRDLARDAAAQVPRGRYGEMLLFFQTAKYGAKHVDRVGYIWHRGDGMHTTADTVFSQHESARWCQRSLS